MAKIIPSMRIGVMVAAGFVAALLSYDGSALATQGQDVRQTRPRAQARPAQQALLPEVVLLPDPVPLPLQVPVLQQAPVAEQAPVPPPAQILDQSAPPPPVQPPDQLPATEQNRLQLQLRPPRLTPPSEQTMPLEQTRFVELASPTPPGPPEIATFGTTDALPPPYMGINLKDHPAVGSWFGRAVQVCPAGVAPSACSGGQPASALFMTPTLTADGIFLGNDSFALLGAPFGPHTTAHGSWVPTSPTDFTAEYVFMSPTFPPVADTVSGFRFRWLAQVISADTAVGYVNLYILPAVPVTWTPLQQDEFPSFPGEASGFVSPPAGVVKDPSTCLASGCPLVFKFTIKRVTR